MYLLIAIGMAITLSGFAIRRVGRAAQGTLCPRGTMIIVGGANCTLLASSVRQGFQALIFSRGIRTST